MRLCVQRVVNEAMKANDQLKLNKIEKTLTDKEKELADEEIECARWLTRDKTPLTHTCGR